MNPAILGFIRHAITLVGGMALANTSLSPDDIETIASAAVIVINLALFAYDRRKAGDILMPGKSKDRDPC